MAQNAFCGELEILLGRIKKSLPQKSDLQEVFDTIVEAEDLITDRKQKIKIADSSKAGWVTVQHLESGGKKDQSAEVQKKVLIAEEAALKDLEGRKRQKRSSSFRQAQDGSSYKHYSAASGENNFRGKTHLLRFSLSKFRVGRIPALFQCFSINS